MKRKRAQRPARRNLAPAGAPPVVAKPATRLSVTLPRPLAIALSRS